MFLPLLLLLPLFLPLLLLLLLCTGGRAGGRAGGFAPRRRGARVLRRWGRPRRGISQLIGDLRLGCCILRLIGGLRLRACMPRLIGGRCLRVCVPRLIGDPGLGSRVGEGLPAATAIRSLRKCGTGMTCSGTIGEGLRSGTTRKGGG